MAEKAPLMSHDVSIKRHANLPFLNSWLWMRSSPLQGVASWTSGTFWVQVRHSLYPRICWYLQHRDAWARATDVGQHSTEHWTRYHQSAERNKAPLRWACAIDEYDVASVDVNACLWFSMVSWRLDYKPLEIDVDRYIHRYTHTHTHT